MGLLTFTINLTLDQQEGIADDDTHAFFTRLMDESGAMLWGRVTYEMMERARRLELISAKPLRSGAVVMHYRRARRLSLPALTGGMP